jgi:hypothetical protein
LYVFYLIVALLLVLFLVKYWGFGIAMDQPRRGGIMVALALNNMEEPRQG